MTQTAPSPFTPPIAPNVYDARNEREFRDMLRRWVNLQDGRLRSPDGRTWQLTVSDAGGLSLVSSDGQIVPVGGTTTPTAIQTLDVV